MYALLNLGTCVRGGKETGEGVRGG
jgi:hypothetical protein